MAAAAAKARLHLVTDQYAAGLFDALRCGFEPARVLRGETFVQKERTDDQRRKANAAFFMRLNGALDVFRETVAMRVVNAITVGGLNMVNEITHAVADLGDI